MNYYRYIMFIECLCFCTIKMLRRIYCATTFITLHYICPHGEQILGPSIYATPMAPTQKNPCSTSVLCQKCFVYKKNFFVLFVWVLEIKK